MTNPRDLRKLVSKVNTTPKGLQSLLGNVNQGINPHELNHLVTPGVDLFQFYGVDKLKGFSNSSAQAPVTGWAVDVTVPEGKLWQIVAAGVAINVAATDETGIGLRLRNPGGISNTVDIPIASFPPITSQVHSGVTVNQVGLVFPNRFFLSAGWLIRGIVLGTNDADSTTMTVTVAAIEIDA